MKKGLTEVVFILDASGSMGHLTDDTIGGFNSVIKEQKGKEGDVLVSTVTFNQQSKVVHDRVAIAEIVPMTEKDYRAGGSTALIDAMGDAIKHISTVHKYIREEDVPEHTLFFITTDGMENASHKYTSDEVKKLVEAKKELGWEFVFMAANIDAVETAAMFGIAEDRAVEYRNDGIGNELKFSTMLRVMNCVRADEVLDSSWKAELEEDVKNREY